MQMRANALSWSPTFPTNILLASEDHNLYTFDIRRLSSPSMIYKGHVAAVMSCDWSPTGTEFVSGGWDRTVRIWQTGQGHAPEVYHTKRMQRVTSTLFTTDARSSCQALTMEMCGYGKERHRKDSESLLREKEQRSSTGAVWWNGGKWTRRLERSPELVIYPNRYIPPTNSKIPCSMREESRRKEEENTHAQGRASPKPSARKLSLWNRVDDVSLPTCTAPIHQQRVCLS